MVVKTDILSREADKSDSLVRQRVSKAQRFHGGGEAVRHEKAFDVDQR